MSRLETDPTERATTACWNNARAVADSAPEHRVNKTGALNKHHDCKTQIVDVFVSHNHGTCVRAGTGCDRVGKAGPGELVGAGETRGVPEARGGHVQKIGGIYFHTTALGTNPRRGGDLELPQTCTYDLYYSTAKKIGGPWSPTKALPRCGNSRFFQDKNGQWYGLTFGCDFFGPLHGRPAIYPVKVEGDRIIPTK